MWCRFELRHIYVFSKFNSSHLKDLKVMVGRRSFAFGKLNVQGQKNVSFRESMNPNPSWRQNMNNGDMSPEILGARMLNTIASIVAQML